MYHRLTGKVIGGMMDIITYTEKIEIELMKSIVIKRLIQIDRSAGTNLAALKAEILHYFRVESCATSSSAQFWNQCARVVERA